MIIHTMEQYSPEWWAIRAGTPSGSNAGKIITPKTMKLSAQAEPYINVLIAEKLGLKDENPFSSSAMENGLETEGEARALFTFETGLEVTEVGWVTNDAGTAGCSPDGLIYADGKPVAGFECKCPLAHTQIGRLRDNVLPNVYKPQVHWSISITGLPWWFLSYYPGLDPFIIEVKADKFTDNMSAAITEFTQRLAEESKRFGLDLPQRKAA